MKTVVAVATLEGGLGWYRRPVVLETMGIQDLEDTVTLVDWVDLPNRMIGTPTSGDPEG